MGMQICPEHDSLRRYSGYVWEARPQGLVYTKMIVISMHSEDFFRTHCSSFFVTVGRDKTHIGKYESKLRRRQPRQVSMRQQLHHGHLPVRLKVSVAHKPRMLTLARVACTGTSTMVGITIPTIAKTKSARKEGE